MILVNEVYFVPGVQVSVSSPVLASSFSSAQSQEQRLALSLCGDELQSLTAAFVCVYCMGDRESGKLPR